jgi:hypothetical protein
MDCKIVARTVVEGSSSPQGNVGAALRRFNIGETGTLTWKPHKEDLEYWAAIIVWDNDPSRTEYRIALVALEFVGLEANGIRFSLSV